MKLLRQEQILPISIEKAWDFFATPKNLNAVTPKELEFKITSELPEKMYEGLLICYKIKPMLNVPLDWVTEITHIKEHQYFIDEQRQGPYRIWHHEHHFEPCEEGTKMTDILHYDVGKWVFGWIASKIFVDRKVQEIFEYRKKILQHYFD